MIRFFRDWLRRHFSDPQILILVVLLGVGILLVLLLGHLLTPLFAAVVIAYVLDGPVSGLQHHRVPRSIAVPFVFILFVAIFLALIIILLPMVIRQIGQFFQDLPGMITGAQQELMRLPERYPDLVSREQIKSILFSLSSELTNLGQGVLTFSIASVKSLFSFFVYLIIVPFMVFFFLKDKLLIRTWFVRFLPENRRLASEVWSEVNQQITNYIRGKLWEILIVSFFSYIVFSLFGLRYTLIISLFTGLSVLIPYIGATAMFFPVALIGYVQWDANSRFFSVMIAYLVIQALDGNLLAPLLLSEVVHLHPIAIIAAVLVFGGLWGIWGLFFAIPLATLVQALLKAWFRTIEKEKNTSLSEPV
ncbi:AI-2E family transporter [candidate division KSB1 bacterium]|nr:AI-2E family transporter [candidate division KSB1 bacterium]